MPALFKILLSLSLSGTLLILLLLLLRPVYRNRLSKRWQYYIWLLVIARLLLPLTPETSLMGTLFRQAEQRIEHSASGASVSASIGTHDTGNTDSNTEPPVDKKDTATNNTGSLTSPADTSEPGTTSPTAAEAENTIRTFCILWLVAALLLFVRKITVYQSFVKYVTAGSKPVDDIALLDRFGQIIAESHVKGTLDLCTNSLVSSPLLIGFIHPRIVLPTTDLSEDDFYYTILHELIHYKRRDIFYKWLVQLAICLHWFNPFVYLMEHEISCSCELSCDERVIMTLSDKSRKSYGDTLLNAIGTGGSYKDTLASVTLNESKELLKERLDAIMKYRKIPKAVQTAAIFFTGILIGGAAVLGAYAAPTAKSSSVRLRITDDTVSSDGKTTTGSTASSDNEASSATGNSMAQDSSTTDQIPDYTIQYEDGTFYILTGGATETDKPSSIVTNGYSCLVLVRKDEYHSFGSWRDREMQNLVRHITPQCQTSLENGRMTQEDMDIVIAAATEIQEVYRSEADIQKTYRSADNIQKFYLFENNDTDFTDDADYFDEWDELEDDTDDNSYFDLSTAPNILDLTRITKQDVSIALQDVLDSCDSGKWYVITENDCRYIYYAGLPHTYAYEPCIDGSETGDLITVAIMDIGVNSPLLRRRESVNDYVLLLFSYAPGAAEKNHNLAITYNGTPVTYDTISVASGTARSIADLYPDTPQSP